MRKYWQHGLAAAALAVWAVPQGVAEETERMSTIHEVSVTTIDGKNTTLAEYRGKALLIVNVASKCGFTKQYVGLQTLYERYKDRGLVILGFPANDFGWQEPGTNAEIKTFCTTKYAVSFPMFAKVTVKGKDMHPLYRLLTTASDDGVKPGRVTWNFNKFLVDRQGRVAARFGSREEPGSDKMVAAIENALGSAAGE